MPETHLSRCWQPGFPVDVRTTLSVLQMHRSDPCHRLTGDGALWRTSLMPTGPVTYRLANVHGLDSVRADAWGPGAEEMIDGLAELLGSGDRPEELEPGHPFLRQAARRLEGLRIPRTGRVFEALVPAVLRQKIQSRDAASSWSLLLLRHGATPPGPAPDGMRVPPAPAGWLAVPVWDWRRAGVEPFAVRVIRRAAEHAGRLESLAKDPGGDRQDLYRALTAIPGVGRWTAAEVGHRALGDADAVSFGDYHIPALVGWALAGRKLTDEEVEPFLDRWRPHRHRVVRLLELTPDAWPPRHGPRLARPEHRHRF